MSNTERERFEARQSAPYNVRLPNGDYAEYATQCAWEAWQAARALSEAGLAEAKSSTEYAWRNARTIDKARTDAEAQVAALQGELAEMTRARDDFKTMYASAGTQNSVLSGRVRCIAEDHEAAVRRAEAAEAQAVALREALIDMLSGWKYIRETHGDLYGVGWGRAQKKAEAALAAAAGQENAATATQLWSADPHTM